MKYLKLYEDFSDWDDDEDEEEDLDVISFDKETGNTIINIQNLIDLFASEGLTINRGDIIHNILGAHTLRFKLNYIDTHSKFSYDTEVPINNEYVYNHCRYKINVITNELDGLDGVDSCGFVTGYYEYIIFFVAYGKSGKTELIN